MADLVYPPAILLGRAVFAGMGWRVHAEGRHFLPRTGGAVLASSHVSYMDFVFAEFAARPSRRLVRFMAKESVFAHPVAGPVMRSMHHIPVNRSAGAASYSHAVDALRAGDVVGVFPEATMSRSMEPKAFKTGAVRMAAEADVPLIPMAVWGTQRLWSYAPESSLKKRRLPIEIRVGEPVAATGDPVQATARLREAVVALVASARDAYPEDGTGQWWYPARLGGAAPEREAEA